MRIIEPFQPGRPIATIRYLNHSERGQVHRHLVSGHNEAPPKFVTVMHAAGHWIACDCLGADPDPPVLHASETKGTVTLVRNTHRAHHAPGCPCGAGLSDAYANIEAHSLHLDAVVLSTTAAAGIDRVWCGTRGDQAPSLVAALRAIVQHLRATPDHHGSPYADRVSTYADALPRLAVRLREQDTPKPQARSALLLTPVTGATRGTLVPWGKAFAPIEVRGPIRYRIDPDVTAPVLLAACRIGAGHDGRYEITCAHLYPVLSRGWPVLTPTRRAMALALLGRAIGSALQQRSVPADVSVGFPSGLTEDPTLTIAPRAGSKRIVLGAKEPHSGCQGSPPDILLLRSADRDQSLRETSAYAGHLSDLILERLKSD